MNQSQTGNYTHLQPQAVAIEKLISAAMAVLPVTDECSEAFTVLEIAQDNARGLNLALDSINEKPEDAHPILFERWVVVRDAINSNPGILEEDDNPLWKELHDLEEDLIDEPVTTLAGLLATLRFAIEEGYNLGEQKGTGTTDRRFTDSLIKNVEALS